MRDVVYLPFEQPNGKPARQRRREGHTDAKRTSGSTDTREQLVLDLDEIARQGAQRMLAHALQAEVEAYLEAAEGERDEFGRALLVKNGYARSRHQVVCGAGAIEVRAPRVNDRRVGEASAERKRFKGAILPPYMRAAGRRLRRSCRCFTCTGSPAETSLRP